MGTALITGASSGLGLEFAKQLAREGNDIVLVARNAQRLEQIADNLRGENGVKVEVLPADLATREGAEVVAHRVASTQRPIGLLVNNAGFGLGQDFIGGKLTKELDALHVMVEAVLITCHVAAKEFSRRGYGGIINVSSAASVTAQGTYSAHKAWVSTFSEGLATDLKGTGVNVTCVTPGLIHTDFHNRSQVDATQWSEFSFTTPDVVVRDALQACSEGKVLTTPTPLYKFAVGLGRLAPRWLVRRFAGPGLSGRGPHVINPEMAGINREKHE